MTDNHWYDNTVNASKNVDKFLADSTLQSHTGVLPVEKTTQDIATHRKY